LQVGLSDAEKLWLDTHTVEDLMHEFMQACLKPRKNSSTEYRGVSLRPDGKYLARVYKRINGVMRRFSASFTMTRFDAARAYDRNTVKVRGR